MVHTCCVDSCSTEKRPNVIFHRFPPADPERLRQWLLALDMDPDTPNFILGKLFVCQKHFLPDDYHDPHMHPGRRARLLKSNAVPSQFLTPRFCEGGQLSPGYLDQLGRPPKKAAVLNKVNKAASGAAVDGSAAFDWGSYLEKETSLAASVSCFEHVGPD